MGQNREKTGRRIAVVRFSALGDVAMSIPVVYSAALKNCGDSFLFITRKPFGQLLVNPPKGITVLELDLKNDYKGIWGMWRLASELKKEYQIDFLLDLHDVLRTKMLRTFLSMKKIESVVINKGRDEKKELTRRRGKILRKLPSTIARYADTFRRAGVDPGSLFHTLYPAPPPLSPELMALIGVGRRPEREMWLGIAPFARHKGKNYPPELMKKVVKTLGGTCGLRIFLFGGGQKEIEILSKWASKYPGVVSLAGKNLGFRNELALMSHLDLMVSMDSGNMHMAAIAGTPVVSIWGATHPFCGFTPWNSKTMSTDETDFIQVDDMPCRPCSVFGDKQCVRGDYACMTRIAPERVIKAIKSRLNLSF